MRFAGCWRPGRIGPVIAMTLLSACATGGSDPSGTACPPVVGKRDVAALCCEA